MKTNTKIAKAPNVLDRILAPALRLLDRMSGRQVAVARPKTRRSA